MNYSLRQLLLFSLLSASMLIWGVTAYMSYKVTRDEVASLFDAELAQSAKVLNVFVESLIREGSLSKHWVQTQTDERLHPYTGRKNKKKQSPFQLWAKGSSGLLARSENAGEFSVHGFSKKILTTSYGMSSTAC